MYLNYILNIVSCMSVKQAPKVTNEKISYQCNHVFWADEEKYGKINYYLATWYCKEVPRSPG